jgi:mRNA interferase MazF
MTINQGDIYWVQSEDPNKSELGHYAHPYIVVQDNVFNHSRVHTIIVCALTTNLKRASSPGNVLLKEGEADLPKQSVVEVSKVSSIPKTQLGKYIGSLSKQRIHEILAGIQFLQSSFLNQ